MTFFPFNPLDPDQNPHLDLDLDPDPKYKPMRIHITDLYNKIRLSSRKEKKYRDRLYSTTTHTGGMTGRN